MSKTLEHGRSKICPNHLSTFIIEQHCIFPTHSARVLTISSLREQLLHFPTHNLLVGSPGGICAAVSRSGTSWRLHPTAPSEKRHLAPTTPFGHPTDQQDTKYPGTRYLSPDRQTLETRVWSQYTFNTRTNSSQYDHQSLEKCRPRALIGATRCGSVAYNMAHCHMAWRSAIPCGSVPHDMAQCHTMRLSGI